MVPFFVQFKCKLGQSYAVANAIAEAEIASEIYSTAGDYDLLVKFYVDNETDIGHFVNEKVQVSRTPTPSSPSRRSAPARTCPLPDQRTSPGTPPRNRSADPAVRIDRHL